MDEQQRSRVLRYKKRIDELRAKRPRKGKVVSFDEKGTIAVKQYGGKVYAESVPKIEAKQNTRGLFEMVYVFSHLASPSTSESC